MATVSSALSEPLLPSDEQVEQPVQQPTTTQRLVRSGVVFAWTLPKLAIALPLTAYAIWFPFIIPGADRWHEQCKLVSPDEQNCPHSSMLWINAGTLTIWLCIIGAFVFSGVSSDALRSYKLTALFPTLPRSFLTLLISVVTPVTLSFVLRTQHPILFDTDPNTSEHIASILMIIFAIVGAIIGTHILSPGADVNTKNTRAAGLSVTTLNAITILTAFDWYDNDVTEMNALPGLDRNGTVALMLMLSLTGILSAVLLYPGSFFQRVVRLCAVDTSVFLGPQRSNEQGAYTWHVVVVALLTMASHALLILCHITLELSRKGPLPHPGTYLKVTISCTVNTLVFISHLCYLLLWGNNTETYNSSYQGIKLAATTQDSSVFGESGEDKAGFIGTYTFWWMWPVIRHAAVQGKLEQHDLPALPLVDRPRRVFSKLYEQLTGRNPFAPAAPEASETEESLPEPEKRSAWWFIVTVIYRIQPRVFMYSMLHGWLFLFCMFIDPIVLRSLLTSTSGHELPPNATMLADTLNSVDDDLVYQLMLVIGLSLSMLVRVSCMEVTYFASLRVMNNSRTALAHAIFAKTLHLPGVGSSSSVTDSTAGDNQDNATEDLSGSKLQSDRSSWDAGKLTNLMATDADNFGSSSWIVFFLAQWTWAVISLPAVLYFLHGLVGNAAFVGGFSIFASSFVAQRISKLTIPVYTRIQEARDRKSKAVKALVSGNKMVKLQTWESVWWERVQDIREEELKELVVVKCYGILNLLVGAIMSLMTPVSVFAWYTIVQGETLTSTVAFTALAWIGQMQWSLNTLPHLYNVYASLSPSAERMLEFLSDDQSDAHASVRPNLEIDKNGHVVSACEVGVVPHVHAGLVAWTAMIQHDGSLQQYGDAECYDGGMTYNTEMNNTEHNNNGGNNVNYSGDSSPSGRNNNNSSSSNNNNNTNTNNNNNNKIAVSLKDATLGFPTRSVLQHVSLNITLGQLTVIVGPVGAGKSTLLATLACAQPLLTGSRNVYVSRAYTEQRAFLLNDTIRANILFGLPLDQTKYDDSIIKAALEPDLDALQRGDMTFVGDNGVQLSGGQQARVALARALYSNADAFFFDDILSAVDATTGRLIWDHCICDLKRRGKAVVLVTHQVQYLSNPHVDNIVVLAASTLSANNHNNNNNAIGSSDGNQNNNNNNINNNNNNNNNNDEANMSNRAPTQIRAVGAWEEVSKLPDMQNLNGTHDNIDSEVTDAIIQSSDSDLSIQTDLLQSAMQEAQVSELQLADGEEATPETLTAQADRLWVTLGECRHAIHDLLTSLRGQEIDDQVLQRVTDQFVGTSESVERKKIGIIAWRDFKVYLDAFGTPSIVALLLVLLLITVGLSVAGNAWLAHWTGANDRGESMGMYGLGVFVALGCAQALSESLQTLLLLLCSFRASRILFDSMFRAVLSAPLSFFDTSSVGRLLNRFLQDMHDVDARVPSSLMDQISSTLAVVAQLSLIFVFAPWTGAVVPLILIPYSLIFSNIRVGARDTRRLESLAKSPVYTFFNDMVRGRSTIHAFGAMERFETKGMDFVAQMSRGKYSHEATMKWAQALTTQNGCVLYLATAVMCVVLTHRGVMTSAQVGLVLLYSAQLQRTAMDYLMNLTYLESKFVSVERIAELSRIKPEEEVCQCVAGSSDMMQGVDHENSNNNNKSWPTSGEIIIEDVTMRYRLHRPSVLRGFSLHIRGGEKCALVGRTGSGKSSALSILARLYPISQGRVLIDGEDISSLPLSQLRSALRVIAQDSILVEGTIRENLTGKFKHGETLETLAMRTVKTRSGILAGTGCGPWRNKGEFEVNAACPTDADVWVALQRVQMAETIRQSPLGLDSLVEDGGTNFSVGERQLICTARALVESTPDMGVDVRTKRVFLCDEATANIDLDTDERVHDVMLDLDATVIMICHRLQHIHRFDRVVVLGDGRVLEEGAPAELMRRTDGALASLLAEAGLQNE